MANRKLKRPTDYRKKILNEIKNYIENTMDIDIIIITDDYNQQIADKEIR